MINVKWIGHYHSLLTEHPLKATPTESVLTNDTLLAISSRLNSDAQTVKSHFGIEIDNHCLCTTICNMHSHFGVSNALDLQKAINTLTENIPIDNYISAYQCASWGYVLRHYVQNVPSTKYLLITILDINFLNMSEFTVNNIWGKSGFGATSVLLDIGKAVESDVVVSAAYSDNHVREFLFAAKRYAQGEIALPFFTSEIEQGSVKSFRSFLKNLSFQDNRFADFGHCFGSDPWISIAHSANEKRLHINKDTLIQNSDQLVTSCSLAYSGFYCFCKAKIDSSTTFTIHKIN
jgi:hypothetical protein